LLVRINGAKKDYAWGSRDLIPDYFGWPKADSPIAEIWFGTHPMGDSVTDSGEQLSSILQQPLGYLVKLLSAQSPLSIQVHPNPLQAIEGFERENQLQIELTDPLRNYKDRSHKPEILIALTPFDALCGFRPKSELAQILKELAAADSQFDALAQLLDKSDLAALFEKLIASNDLASRFSSIDFGSLGPAADSARKLALSLLEKYPGDTGALVALLLNHVQLSAGEAIFLPAGNLHAYLSGLGVEVMAASDNVIRGGLTPKHVDTAELKKIVDFVELTEPKVRVRKLATGLAEYPVSVSDFRVYRAEVSSSNLFADLDLSGPVMVLCTSGEVAVGTSLEEREVISAAEVLYCQGAKKLSLSGSGSVFLIFGN
jgi:mannose-6-phosphate isomerase